MDTKAFLTGLGALILFGWLGTTFLGSGGCVEGDFYRSCQGSDVLLYSCSNGFWHTTVVPSQMNESCYQGTFISKTCTDGRVESSCFNAYTVLRVECVSGSPVPSRVSCDRNQYCLDGACIGSPSSCGDYVCDNLTENMVNCYLDCGGLSSWDQYYASIPENVSRDYLYCGGVYDCGNPVVDEAIADMEEHYNPKTPKEWIESASKYVYGLFRYRLDGGEAQCGETTSDLLERTLHPAYYGETIPANCVDYSTVLATMCKRKGIPAGTAGVCLTNNGSWDCNKYALGISIPLPNPLGRIDGKPDNALGGQVYGHSVTIIYNPLTDRMEIADPTMNGVGLTKNCYGYSEYLNYGGAESQKDQVCYITKYNQLKECQGF